MIRVNLHNDIMGCVCVLDKQAASIDKVYGFNWGKTLRLLIFQDTHDLKFIVLKEKPFWHLNAWFYCVAELPDMEEWHWYNLNQLIVCNS